MKSTNKENFKAQLCQYHQYRVNMKTEKKRTDLIKDLFLEYLKNYSYQFELQHIDIQHIAVMSNVSCKNQIIILKGKQINESIIP